MIKEVLLECEKAGMEIEFIRCDDLDINICSGCCKCVASLASKPVVENVSTMMIFI